MVRIASVKAISFDGDGTLWDFERVMRHSLQFVLKELERLDLPSATS
jgi:phosphoglycolate phosphatase-like HAD superfamily hydrolase